MAMQGTKHNLATITCGPEMPKAHATKGSGTYFFEMNWTRYDDRSLDYSRHEFDFVIPAVDTWKVKGTEYTFTTQRIEIICGDERRVICGFDDELPEAPPEIEFRAEQITKPVNG